MTTEQFASWLKQWLVRHPMKSPTDTTHASYTQEVMARLEAVSHPAPARWPSWRPQWVVAFGGAVAAMFLVLTMGRHPQQQLAQEEGRIHELAQIVNAVGEDPVEVAAEVEATDPDAVANELITLDRLVLAETPKSSDASQDIWRDLDILNQLDDASAISAESLESGSDENADDLLKELESLDHASSA